MFMQHAQSHLVELEENYVQLMHHGIQCYSRPLRHAVLSSDQHSAMFQNIEKVTLLYLLWCIYCFHFIIILI